MVFIISNLAQNLLQREWGNFPFANWNRICLGLPLQLVQLIKIHFLPHLEPFMWQRKFEKKFFKKNPIQPPNGVHYICKLPFPNGSNRNGVCRGFWALSTMSPILICKYLSVPSLQTSMHFFFHIIIIILESIKA